MHDPHVRYTADEYDEFTGKFLATYDEMTTRRIAGELAGRSPGAVVLDVGTGTARLLVRFARDPAFVAARLVGTDLYQDMIDRARRTIAEAGLGDRIELLVQDAHAMTDVPDASADVVLSRSTIHHWTDPARAFAEMYRVLRPGGVAFVHDVRRDPAPEALAAFNRTRAAAGLGPSFLDEKYTTAEAAMFIDRAGLTAYTTIRAPESGLGGLGFEVEIRKPV
ncbi:MAG TPA: class I SAM-dependent methyltransferase [Gemmataceae bacterium]|jgi:ubiquinone/menaquinone biosynthesis C-methylase UbiE|nr:class I SAM-dependent methyltransferase [Gemmataceae bacterium]